MISDLEVVLEWRLKFILGTWFSVQSLNVFS